MSAETFLPALIIGGLTSAGVAADTITQNTSVPLSMVAGIFCFVTPLVWWLSRKLTSIEDKIETVETKVQTLSNDLATRPCQRTDECPRGPVQ